jgi:hypothetical protein
MFTLIIKRVFSLKTHLKIVTHRLDFNKVKSTRATYQITMHSTLYSSLSARTCEIVDRIIYLSFYWHKCVKSLQKRVSLKLLHRKCKPHSVQVNLNNFYTHHLAFLQKIPRVANRIPRELRHMNQPTYRI